MLLVVLTKSCCFQMGGVCLGSTPFQSRYNTLLLNAAAGKQRLPKQDLSPLDTANELFAKLKEGKLVTAVRGCVSCSGFRMIASICSPACAFFVFACHSTLSSQALVTTAAASRCYVPAEGMKNNATGTRSQRMRRTQLH